MQRCEPSVLALNAGSSSIRFALFRPDDPPTRKLGGKLDRIGLPDSRLTFADAIRGQRDSRVVAAADHASAATLLLDWLDERVGLSSLAAAGHRIAHGGPRYAEPQRVTPELVDELRRISAFAPGHLPPEIALIDALGARAPRMPQVACFDTAFHRGMPRVAKLMPLPRRLEAAGVERYGFHGLSYAFLMEELARTAGAKTAQGRVILAHLGNGASLAAVRGGTSIDTSMAFTPAAGVPMSSRSGDIDPGLPLFLAQAEGMTAEAFHRMVNEESGLLGISETSADMRDLLACEANDPRAAEAVAVFCYHVRKWIGAFAAALGGVDTLVFAGGIGENVPVVRARICQRLAFLGIELDPARNASNAPIVSPDRGRTGVRVIRTDEEAMIAQAIVRVVGGERIEHPARSRSPS